MQKRLLVTACLMAVLVLTVQESRGALLNGFNELGKITDASLPGPAGHVISGVVVVGIAPSEGDAYAYLTTGPELDDFEGSNGQGDSGIDRTGNGSFEGDVAIGIVEFTLPEPMTVAFDYDFLTGEVSGGVPDPFEIKLDDTTVASGVVALENGSFPIVPAGEFDGTEYTGPDGSFFPDGRIGWTTVDLGMLAAGLHTLEFFVGDDDDLVVDSALLVDNLRARSDDGSIPEPATMAIWTLLGLIGIAAGYRRNR